MGLRVRGVGGLALLGCFPAPALSRRKREKDGYGWGFVGGPA